jgi:hypothetical protein
MHNITTSLEPWLPPAAAADSNISNPTTPIPAHAWSLLDYNIGYA